MQDAPSRSLSHVARAGACRFHGVSLGWAAAMTRAPSQAVANEALKSLQKNHPARRLPSPEAKRAMVGGLFGILRLSMRT